MKTVSQSLLLAAISGTLFGASGYAFASQAEANSMMPIPASANNGSAMSGDKHACKGQNACKGKGGCKSDKHACKGQNACKGQGGCKSA